MPRLVRRGVGEVAGAGDTGPGLDVDALWGIATQYSRLHSSPSPTLNASQQVLSTSMEGHFLVEQARVWRNGRPNNFTGSAQQRPLSSGFVANFQKFFSTLQTEEPSLFAALTEAGILVEPGDSRSRGSHSGPRQPRSSHTGKSTKKWKGGKKKKRGRGRKSARPSKELSEPGPAPLDPGPTPSLSRNESNLSTLSAASNASNTSWDEDETLLRLLVDAAETKSLSALLLACKMLLEGDRMASDPNDGQYTISSDDTAILKTLHVDDPRRFGVAVGSTS